MATMASRLIRNASRNSRSRVPGPWAGGVAGIDRADLPAVRRVRAGATWVRAETVGRERARMCPKGSTTPGFCQLSRAGGPVGVSGGGPGLVALCSEPC